jgi:putative transposase
VAHDIRDSIMDFIRYWSGRTEIPALRLVNWAGLSRSKFYHWRERYGKANEHWQLRCSMTEADVEIIIQAAVENYPGAKARVITDNGPQFIARDFKEFIRIAGLTHVKTSPYYPQSNGKIERWHQTLKANCLRPGCPLSIEDARRLVERFVTHYNTVRLHSAIGYITPADRLADRHLEIFAARDKKLDAARQNPKLKRQQLTQQQLP